MFSSSLRTAPRHVLPAHRTLRSFSPSPRSYLHQGPAGTSVAIEVPPAHTSTKMGSMGTRTGGVEYRMFRRRHVRLGSRACLDGDDRSKDALLLQGRHRHSRPGSGNAREQRMPPMLSRIHVNCQRTCLARASSTQPSSEIAVTCTRAGAPGLYLTDMQDHGQRKCSVAYCHCSWLRA